MPYGTPGERSGLPFRSWGLCADVDYPQRALLSLESPVPPIGNPSVTGGYSLWTKVRRKGKGPPWPGGSGNPLGTLRRWFLRGRGGGQGLPPPLAEAQSVHRGYGPPGRCFRRVPPEPPGHNKACTPPLFTEGLQTPSRQAREREGKRHRAEGIGQNREPGARAGAAFSFCQFHFTTNPKEIIL